MTCCVCMISYKYEQALPSNRHVLPGFVRNDFTTIVKKKTHLPLRISFYLGAFVNCFPKHLS